LKQHFGLPKSDLHESGEIIGFGCEYVIIILSGIWSNICMLVVVVVVFQFLNRYGACRWNVSGNYRIENTRLKYIDWNTYIVLICDGLALPKI